MIRRFIQLFIFLIIQIAMIGSLSAESNLSASRDRIAQNFEFLSPITSFLLGDDQGLANTIQNCDADYIRSGGSGVGNIQFNMFSGNITSAEAEANLGGVNVFVIGRVDSDVGEESFISFPSVQTNIDGSFERDFRTQFRTPFENDSFISVETFFSRNEFEFELVSLDSGFVQIIYDVSSAECVSSDTDLEASIVIAQ